MPDYRSVAVAAAQQYGIDPNIFLRQINQESGFNPNARSSAGAVGIAQFMPSTAAGMGIDPSDPRQALYGAAKMDAANIKKYGGWAPALSAYNSGQPTAYKDPNFAGGQTYNYVKDILGGARGSGTSSKPSQALTSGLSGGFQPSQVQQALAMQLLQQSTLEAAGKTPAGNDALSGSQSLLDMAMTRRQLQAATNVFGPGKTSVQIGNITMHNVAPSSNKDVAAVHMVKEYLGTPYQWGGESPQGFDCSGLLQYVWGKQGVNIPRTTYDQWQTGQAVSTKGLRPGDAVFFKGSDAKVVNGQLLPGHVGMYIGDGKIVQAPHTGSTVQITNLKDMPGYMGARRYA